MKILAEKYHEQKIDLEDFLKNSFSVNLEIDELVNALDEFSKKVFEVDLDEEILNEVSKFCSKSEIENKIITELGSLEAFDIKRRDFKTRPMESFYPLGAVLHITPSNSPGLAFLAMVESLVGLNSNIVKLSRRDSDECFKLCEKLFACDSTGKISKKTIVLQDAPYELDELIRSCDAVSCWGGDTSIEKIRSLVPVSKRFITWGHKISFSLISNKRIDQESALNLAKDIVKFDQLACSAPQVCYILDSSFEDLTKFSKYLKESLNELSSTKKLGDLDIQEQAELTNIKELLELESVFEDKDVISSETNDWRIYLENNSEFKASPLKRSIWLKPIKSSDLINTLRPFRDHLQTVGVSFDPSSLYVINELFKAGALRVRDLGSMQDSYSGEPHDGEQALSRFVKRISLDTEMLSQNYRFEEAIAPKQSDKSTSVMTKSDFQALVPDYDKAHLFFRSGGSSGKTAISPFSYKAYHRQMQAAAEGLFAAGLDPRGDRVANLFFGGGLYGGFLSFYTILEKLEIVQYPLAAYDDREFVAKTLAENNINTIVGMPSFIVELFESQKDILKNSSIDKIFYGGEHFSKKHREWLQSEFGIKIIRSASYGSVDAGPLGFQCEYSEGSIHHLNESIQDLEILKIDSDRKVDGEKIGRLVFTSKARDCIQIERYDLGDLGRWVLGKCKCGRENRRFELLGRHGDIFRAGGTFFNFIKFQKLLLDEFDYSDSLQIMIDQFDGKDRVNLRLLGPTFNEEELIKCYQDLREAVIDEKTLFFKIENIEQSCMEHSANSGKLLRVIDKREL
jgi:phenylacetate-coenzyme A ligase PaaK-like adenylate-forming protein